MSIDLIDINRVVDAVMSLVTPTAREKGVSLKLEQCSSMPLVRANEGVIQQVFLNILLNAIQACENNGKINVSLKADTSAHIIIKDNGCGISRVDLKRIFDPFYSRRQMGTGLGLFLSLSFVRKFGGDIRVESELGGGSCFEILLPLP